MQSYLYRFLLFSPALWLVLALPGSLQAQGDPDCVNSIVLCSNASISFNPSGIGQVNDFASPANSQGCLTTGERNTAWYYFAFNDNMPANSQIEFTISPTSPADYDFAVYGPDVNCNGLGSPVRCSYAAGTGSTGLGNGATDTSENAGGDGWVAPLTVQPGQGFYLVIDNFSGNGAGFNMSWGGSAAPFLDCTVDPSCNIQPNYVPSYSVCQSGAPIVFQGSVLGLEPGVATEYSWSAPSGLNFLNNPFSANPTFTPPTNQAGTFNYTLTITQGSCQQTATVSVTVFSQPTVVINGPTSLCIGVQITLSATPGFAVYSWSTGSFGPNTTVNAPGTYTVTVTNANGCQAIATHTVSGTPPPTPQITGPTDLCPNTPGSLNAGPGYTAYQWSTGSTSQTTLIPGPGTYSVTVVQNGCTGVGQFTVATTPPPTASIDGEPFICAGQSTNLTASPGFDLYLWSTGSSGPSITVTNAGTYSVTVVDAAGCTGIASFTVAQAAPITPTISGDLTVCTGSPATLNVSGNYTSYAWSNGSSGPSISVDQPGNYTVTVTGQFGCTGTATATVTSSPDPVPTITGNPAFCSGSSTALAASPGYAGYLWSNGSSNPSIQVSQPGQYSVIVSTAAGCLGETAIQVIENPLPAPTISGPSEICPGTTATLEVNEAFSNYSWSNGQGGPTITVSNQGNYQVTVTDMNGCQGTAIWAVGVLPPPMPIITGETSFCENGNTTLSVVGTGLSGFSWSTGSNQASINVSQAGNYSVTVTDNAGCTGSASTTVTVIPNPLPSISAPSLFCQGSTATLQASSGFSSYEWSTGAIGQNLTVNAPGSYTVTVANAAGCRGSATVTIDQAPLPVVSIGGSLSFCTNSSTALSANGTFAAYAWSTGSTQPGITVSQPGNYSLTVTDTNGCSNSAAVVVTEVPQLQPQISGIPSFCSGSASALDAGPGFATYAWSSGSTGQGITVSSPGNYSVTVTDANGCSGSGSIAVVEHPLPALSISGVDSYCAGSSTSLSATPGLAVYQWSNNASGPLIAVSAPGIYSVTASDNNGCSNSASINIIELPLPAPAITGALSFCPGGSTTLGLDNSYSLYLWSNGNTGPSTELAAPGSISVTVTDVNGCTNVAMAQVSLYTPPQPQISGALEYCQGGSTTLQANTSYASYAWSSGQTSPALTLSQPGTYGLTVVDNNGCEGSASATVVENALPQPSITGPDTFCEGSIATLDAGPGYQAYQWTGNQSGQQLDLTLSGTYSVTVTNANGCQGSASLSVESIAAPVPQILGALDFCPGTSTALSAGGGSFAAYAWSNGATDTLIEVSQTGTYSLTVTDALGCAGSASAEVNTFATSAPAISGDLNFCPGQATVLTAQSGFTDYTWSNGQTGPSLDVDSNGSYSISATDSNGCAVSSTVTVEAYTVEAPAISGALEYCQGSSTTLHAAAGYASYAWSNGQTGAALTLSQPGTYTVSVVDNNGCESDASVAVAENALPEPVIAGAEAFCAGSSTTLDAGSGYQAYQWSGNQSSQELDVNQAGTYSVTVTDANGCQGSASQTVTAIAAPVPQIVGTLDFCPGTSTELSAGGGSFAAYAWSNGSTASLIEVTQSGTYSLTVTDAFGCTGAVSTEANTFAITAPAISGGLNFCPGQATELTAESGYTDYLWSNGQLGSSLSVSSQGSYSVSATDSNGCAVSSTVDVAAFAVAVPTISGDANFCQGESAVLSGMAGFTAYQWSNGVQGASITASAAGLYALTVTDANGCQTQNSIQVTVFSLPSVNIGGSTSYCIGGSTTLNAGAVYSQYLWSNGSTAPSIQVNQPQTYGLTVTDANGCVGSAEVAVLEDIELNPVISGSPAFCPGLSTTLDAGAGFQTYNWSNGASSQTLSVDAPGTYSVTVTDAFGCIGDTVVTVSEYPAPQVNIAGELNYCAGAATQLAAAGGTFALYNWSTGAAGPQITANQPGTYGLTITDGNGCQESTQVAVVENPLPVFSISGALSFCAGEQTTLAATPGFAAYQWSNGQQTAAIDISAAGAYGVTVTNSFGCTSQQAATAVQVPLPLADPGAPRVIDCYFPEVSLGGPNSSQGSNIQYQWEGPGIDASNANQQFPSVDVAGTYVLTVVNTTLGCTSTPASIQVEDFTAPPEVALQALNVLNCSASSATIDGSGSSSGASITYQWFDNSMAPISGAQAAALSVSAPGQYFLLVTNTASGCTALGSTEVEEDREYPSANAGLPGHLDCSSPTVPLNGSATATPSISINWTTPNGSILSGGQSLNPVVNQPGLYILQVLNTTNGCASLDSVLVTQDIDLPQADAGPPQEIDCLSPQATLDGSGSALGSQYTYEWAFGNLDNIVGNGLSLTVEQAGTYILIVTDTDNGCRNTRTVVVTQNSAEPTGLSLAERIPTCFGDRDGSLIIEGVEGGTPPFLYSFNGQPFGMQRIFNNLAAGVYPIVIQDATGCEFSLDAVLPDGNDLWVDLGADITLKLGQEARLEAIVSVPLSEIAAIAWSATDSLSCYDCLTPIVRPSASGTYRLRVTDRNGCTAEDRLTLFLNKQRNLYVPNAFSPNGDGNNDVFMVFAGPEVVRLHSFQVYSRWGEPVFEVYGTMPNNPDHGWDGTFHGQVLNTAVFVWMAEVEFVDGVVEVFKGDVVLLR
jgi:gliding motility-associated-like protein